MLLAAALAALALAGCADGHRARGERGEGEPRRAAGPTGEAALPAPDAPIPRQPDQLARRLRETNDELDRRIFRSLKNGDPSRGEPPADVLLYALHQQRIYRLLARQRVLAARTLPLLPARPRRAVREILGALRDLRRLTPPTPPARVRTGRALPAGRLLR